MNHQAKNSSFWQLISNKQIEIPNYQREYAQGRNNNRAEGIRKGLVEALYSALENNSPLELDFIFGGKEDNNNDDEFHPVDGQQRLTILYLLHWYIFQRTNDETALNTLKDHFSYATRTTARTFCEKICDGGLSLNWNEDTLSVQLKDKSWFTGAMGYDPTVQSMLVVLDCIHQKFCAKSDFTDLANKVKSGNCSITFFYYDLSDNGTSFNVRDLYIKMNARGLQLTDFEIFKAELQKKTPSGFDLLKKYFESHKIEDSQTERVKLIGKFNTDYTNFFFKLINEKGTVSEKFDQAMMNFINEIFRTDFFCAVSEKGVSQKDYRYDHDTIKRLHGKEFYNFIKDSGKLLIDRYIEPNKGKETEKITYDDAQNAFNSSLTRIITLLDMFSDSSKETIFKKEPSEEIGYALFDDLIVGDKNVSGLAVDPSEDKTLSFGDFVARNALYTFIEKSGVPKDENTEKNYKAWNRFVWKIVRNTDFKSFNEAVETLRGLRQICEKISTSVYEVLSSIEKIGKDENREFQFIKESESVTMGSPARLQFEEEALKARLIIKDDNWEGEIITAENHFSADGQIWFLLDLAKRDDTWDLNNFKTAVTITEKLFDKDKKLKVESSLFERALLAVGAYDNNFKEKDHLEQMSSKARNTKKFVGKDFHEHLSHRYAAANDMPEKDRYDVVFNLLETMVEEKAKDIIGWLKEYIKNAIKEHYFSDLPEWKKILIQYDIFEKTAGGFQFKNCFESEAWSDDSSAIAIFNTQTRRINSGELHSFALALKIQSNLPGSNIKYYPSSSETYLDNNFPNRYFTVEYPGKETLKIGYKNGNFLIDNSDTGTGDIEKAADELCKRLGLQSVTPKAV